MKRLLFLFVVWAALACSSTPKTEENVRDKVTQFGNRIDLRDIQCHVKDGGDCGSCSAHCFGKTATGLPVYFHCDKDSCTLDDIEPVQVGAEREEF